MLSDTYRLTSRAAACTGVFYGNELRSVSSKQISDELNKQGFKIDKKKILLDDVLTSLGYHNVKIELHKKVIAKLNINVEQEEYHG